MGGSYYAPIFFSFLSQAKLASVNNIRHKAAQNKAFRGYQIAEESFRIYQHPLRAIKLENRCYVEIYEGPYCIF